MMEEDEDELMDIQDVLDEYKELDINYNDNSMAYNESVVNP